MREPGCFFSSKNRLFQKWSTKWTKPGNFRLKTTRIILSSICWDAFEGPKKGMNSIMTKHTHLVTIISPFEVLVKMMFLFSRWDMLDNFCSRSVIDLLPLPYHQPNGSIGDHFPYTHRKFNIAPEKSWLEKSGRFLFGISFRVTSSKQENASNQIGQIFQKIPNPPFFSGLVDLAWNSKPPPKPGFFSPSVAGICRKMWPPSRSFTGNAPEKRWFISRRKTAFPALGSPGNFFVGANWLAEIEAH